MSKYLFQSIYQSHSMNFKSLNDITVQFQNSYLPTDSDDVAEAIRETPLFKLGKIWEVHDQVIKEPSKTKMERGTVTSQFAGNVDKEEREHRPGGKR